VSALAAKIVAVHQALAQADLPHAFGGALALAWCTQAARATIDIDVNLFVSVDQAAEVFAQLPAAVEKPNKALKQLVRDTQVRLWWEHTPLDIFLNSTPYHSEAAQRVRWEQFSGQPIPFLSCQDLAVFKAFFNRTKDWADLEAMHEAGTLDTRFVSGVIMEYLGPDDERIHSLLKLKHTAS
jgi:hypothetical protein